MRARSKVLIIRKNMQVIVAVLLALVAGCKDDNGLVGTGQLKIYLINTPANYDSVVVIVREVSVYSERQGWIVVGSATRTFDLLQLPHGARSLLGETSLEAGSYTQIRLLLDAASYAVVSGRHRPIAIPAGLEMIRLVHQFQVGTNHLNELYVDFDANGNACVCKCCRQFKSILHVSTSPYKPGTERRLKVGKRSDRCSCGDRWDHRQGGRHCRHCTSTKSSVGEIG